MPTPLEWNQTKPHVLRARRTVPGYGKLIFLARFAEGPEPVKHVMRTAVLIPEPEGHEAEIIQGMLDVPPAHSAEQVVKEFFQEFIDRIEQRVVGRLPVHRGIALVDDYPDWVITLGEPTPALMCLTCGLWSNVPEDVRQRVCRNCAGRGN